MNIFLNRNLYGEIKKIELDLPIYATKPDFIYVTGVDISKFEEADLASLKIRRNW